MNITMNTIAKKILEHLEKLPDQMQEETLDFVCFLEKKAKASERKLQKPEPNGTRLARLMQEASHKNLFSHIKDPAAWQREIREDPPLTKPTPNN